MEKSRLITGIIMVFLGCFLIFLGTFKKIYPTLIYGVPIFVIGVIIFFNSSEDKIEEIKKAKGGKNER